MTTAELAKFAADREVAQEWCIDLRLFFEADGFDAAMAVLDRVAAETKSERGVQIAGLDVCGPVQPPKPNPGVRWAGPWMQRCQS